MHINTLARGVRHGGMPIQMHLDLVREHLPASQLRTKGLKGGGGHVTWFTPGQDRASFRSLSP